MAKVQITAKALLRNGMLTNEAGYREEVLKVVGKNDKLLKEMRVHGYPLARSIELNGDDYVIYVIPDKNNGRVTVQLLDLYRDIHGSATFGYTSFFKCLEGGDE